MSHPRRSQAGERPSRPGIPNEGFVRLKAILAPVGPIPVSKSTWWAGVASGRYPKPIKLGPRITAWRAEEIRALMEDGTDER